MSALVLFVLADCVEAKCSTSGNTSTGTKHGCDLSAEHWRKLYRKRYLAPSAGPYAAGIDSSSIDVSGLSGTIASIQVTLNGMTANGHRNEYGEYQFSSVSGTGLMLVLPGNKELEIFGEAGDGVRRPIRSSGVFLLTGTL